MTFTQMPPTGTPLLEFYVTARWTEHHDGQIEPFGVPMPSAVFVTKMGRFRAQPDELIGAFADRVCAAFVAERGDQDRLTPYGRRKFRQKLGMRLVFSGRLCEETCPVKEYFSKGTPFLELEVRGV